MFLSFCLLILCIIALFTKDNHRLYEKRNLTDLVKWIAAIAVVISHLCTFYMHSPTLATECRFRNLSVSIFFFLSGYGLICSLQCSTSCMLALHVCVILYYIVNYLFIILAVYILQGANNIKKLKIKRNYYYEIYLIQGSVFLLLSTTVNNKTLFFTLAIISTILFSLGMNWVNQKIASLIKI